MTLHKTLPGKRTRFYALFLLLFLALLAGIGPHAVAQDEEGTATWADPLNLSQSGAATAPQTVTDAGGTTHVIWQDEIANSFVYVNGEVGDWSAPAAVELPFGTRQYVTDLDEDDPTPLFSPQLVADGTGRIHAFWLNEEGQGFHSSVAADGFDQFATWTVPVPLAEAAAALDVVADADGRLHFAYIRTVATDSSPAGVYYRRSSTGAEWSDPTLLDRSAYFRSLAPERANVQVDAGSGGNTGPVYVVWDNRSLERVFVARSTNSGQTWIDAEVIDERAEDDPLEGVGPSNVMVSASGDDVLLLWQAGHGAFNCAQYFQWSADGGSTWEPRQRMLDELPACPTQNQLAKADDGLTFLLTTVDAQPYLLAWNGSEWSTLQPEPILAGFISPETYRRVAFSCLQLDVVDGRFLVVGCGLSEDEDVWLTSRSTGAVATWFPPPSVWSESVMVSSSTAPIMAPALAADGSSRIHAVWSQVSETDENTVLYYARWDGTDWSRPAPVLSSPGADVRQPAVAVHPAGVILVTWQDEAGQVYFSRANAERANIATEWFGATPLIRPPTAGSAPDVLVDRAGRVYIAYAVPLNEGRGIYLITSDDLGETWTEPLLVADAAAAGWPMVDRPRLAATGGEGLHLLWTSYSLPPDATPQGLYYARIGAGDATWSDPSVVAEEVVIWSDVIGVGTRTVHQVWQTVEDDRAAFWHNVSDDGGLTWQRAERLAGLAETPGRAAIAADDAGRVHLVQATAGGLEYQWWAGSWNDGERLPVNELAGEPVVALAVSSSADETAPAGDLRVVYAGQQAASGAGFGAGPRPAREEEEEAETITYELRAAGQVVDIPAGVSTPLPTLTPTPSPMPTETPTPGPSPTPTIVFPAGAEAESSGLLPSLPGGNSPWAGLVLGVVSVVLVVGIAFVIGLRVVRSGQN